MPGVKPLRTLLCAVYILSLAVRPATAQTAGGRAQIQGRVTDQTSGALPGVSVQLRSAAGATAEAVTDGEGHYVFDAVAPGRYELQFTLVNFGSVTHGDVDVKAGSNTVDEIMHLALNAEVVVVGKNTFANLADVANPAENLVGIAQSASQGAITSRQLDVRPFMRQGEVLETVPGVIITQHSGEGKANQYFLRGFNLDHGSDFATTVAGVPVNMPTHAHSQGYSDINFLIPELVAGVQFSKGPYYADVGDFGTAGNSNINYAATLDRPIASPRGRHLRLRPRPLRGVASGRRGSPARGLRDVDQFGAVVGARLVPQAERRPAVFARRQRERAHHHRHGL